MKIYVSSKGNDQYVMSPLKIARAPFCAKINDDYRKFLMKELSTTSDLPNSDEADICPLFVKVNRKADKYDDNFIFHFGFVEDVFRQRLCVCRGQYSKVLAEWMVQGTHIDI